MADRLDAAAGLCPRAKYLRWLVYRAIEPTTPPLLEFVLGQRSVGSADAQQAPQKPVVEPTPLEQYIESKQAAQAPQKPVVEPTPLVPRKRGRPRKNP